MEAFSLRVRRRIIELFQGGLEGDDVAEIMACSPAAARRIWQRYREEGLVGPRPHAGGHVPKLGDEEKKRTLGELVAQKPDAFCRELASHAGAVGGLDGRSCSSSIRSWRPCSRPEYRLCSRSTFSGNVSPTPRSRRCWTACMTR